MTTSDRQQAARQRRAAAARQGLDRRSYPPGAGRDRGLRRPAPEQMSVEEALRELEAEDRT